MDQTFLSCLQTKGFYIINKKEKYNKIYLKDTFKNLIYWEIVFNTTEISFSLSLISLFMIIFHDLLYKKLSEQMFIVIVLIFSAAATFIYIILSPKIFKIHTILSNIKSIGIIIGTLFLFCPVMKTVFQNYVENTTYALAFG